MWSWLQLPGFLHHTRCEVISRCQATWSWLSLEMHHRWSRFFTTVNGGYTYSATRKGPSGYRWCILSQFLVRQDSPSDGFPKVLVKPFRWLSVQQFPFWIVHGIRIARHFVDVHGVFCIVRVTVFLIVSSGSIVCKHGSWKITRSFLDKS